MGTREAVLLYWDIWEGKHLRNHECMIWYEVLLAEGTSHKTRRMYQGEIETARQCVRVSEGSDKQSPQKLLDEGILSLFLVQQEVHAGVWN